MTWKIYYDDGSVSVDEITQPMRVIAIVQPREKTGREVLREYPYYILRRGKWRSADDVVSLVQQVIYYLDEIEAVVMGIYADEKTYARIVEQAMTEPGLPRRSANVTDRRR